MKAKGTLGIVVFSAFSILGHAQNKPCPALLGVTRDGRYFMDRGGAWVRQSPGVIKTMIAGGCYPEGGPSPTSAVTVAVAAGAPLARTAALYSLLAETGWPKENVAVEAWTNPPQRPHPSNSR